MHLLRNQTMQAALSDSNNGFFFVSHNRRIRKLTLLSCNQLVAEQKLITPPACLKLGAVQLTVSSIFNLKRNKQKWRNRFLCSSNYIRFRNSKQLRGILPFSVVFLNSYYLPAGRSTEADEKHWIKISLQEIKSSNDF